MGRFEEAVQCFGCSTAVVLLRHPRRGVDLRCGRCPVCGLVIERVACGATSD